MRAFVVASSPHSILPDLLKPQPGDVVIAADGGADRCAEWGWPVDVVVGDLDSVTPGVVQELRERGVPFLAFPAEKDETDLELALRVAVQAGPDEIVIAGALGARIDHTLGNLALLALPELASVPTRMVDGSQTITLVRSQLTLPGRPGDTLSLIPFGGDAVGVTVTGVHWPLHEATLRLGPSLGISNRFEADCARIQVGNGAVLAIHTRAEAISKAT